MENPNTYHTSVMPNEVIEALNIKPNGVYVDATYGGGGHSKLILNLLNEKGKLIAFDQDADAATQLVQDDRLIFIPENFMYVQKFLRAHGIEKVDGVLADLGVSSHQFDVAERGFSTRFDGPLDMRMDVRQQIKAADIVNQASENELHKIFEQYGEVTNAKTVAKYIIDAREKSFIKTIAQFKNILQPIVKGNPAKYFAKIFQALRIEVNQEIQVLKDFLLQTPGIINQGGRLVIITFHSLEDRVVKNFLKDGAFDVEQTNEFDFFGNKKQKHFKPINKKPIVATSHEQKNNSRSRSAKLRIGEKI